MIRHAVNRILFLTHLTGGGGEQGGVLWPQIIREPDDEAEFSKSEQRSSASQVT